MNTPILAEEVKTIIKNLPIKKTPGLNGFIGNFFLHLKRKYYQSCINSFRKYKKKEQFLIHFIRPVNLDTNT